MKRLLKITIAALFILSTIFMLFSCGKEKITLNELVEINKEENIFKSFDNYYIEKTVGALTFSYYVTKDYVAVNEYGITILKDNNKYFTYDNIDYIIYANKEDSEYRNLVSKILENLEGEISSKKEDGKVAYLIKDTTITFELDTETNLLKSFKDDEASYEIEYNKDALEDIKEAINLIANKDKKVEYVFNKGTSFEKNYVVEYNSYCFEIIAPFGNEDTNWYLNENYTIPCYDVMTFENNKVYSKDNLTDFYELLEANTNETILENHKNACIKDLNGNIVGFYNNEVVYIPEGNVNSFNIDGATYYLNDNNDMMISFDFFENDKNYSLINYLFDIGSEVLSYQENGEEIIVRSGEISVYLFPVSNLKKDSHFLETICTFDIKTKDLKSVALCYVNGEKEETVYKAYVEYDIETPEVVDSFLNTYSKTNKRHIYSEIINENIVIDTYIPVGVIPHFNFGDYQDVYTIFSDKECVKYFENGDWKNDGDISIYVSTDILERLKRNNTKDSWLFLNDSALIALTGNPANGIDSISDYYYFSNDEYVIVKSTNDSSMLYLNYFSYVIEDGVVSMNPVDGHTDRFENVFFDSESDKLVYSNTKINGDKAIITFTENNVTFEFTVLKDTLLITRYRVAMSLFGTEKTWLVDYSVVYNVDIPKSGQDIYNAVYSDGYEYIDVIFFPGNSNHCSYAIIPGVDYKFNNDNIFTVYEEETLENITDKLESDAIYIGSKELNEYVYQNTLEKILERHSSFKMVVDSEDEEIYSIFYNKDYEYYKRDRFEVFHQGLIEIDNIDGELSYVAGSKYPIAGDEAFNIAIGSELIEQIGEVEDKFACATYSNDIISFYYFDKETKEISKIIKYKNDPQTGILLTVVYSFIFDCDAPDEIKPYLDIIDDAKWNIKVESINRGTTEIVALNFDYTCYYYFSGYVRLFEDENMTKPVTKMSISNNEYYAALYDDLVKISFESLDS